MGLGDIFELEVPFLVPLSDKSFRELVPVSLTLIKVAIDCPILSLNTFRYFLISSYR